MDEDEGPLIEDRTVARALPVTEAWSVPAGRFFVFEGIDGSGKSTISRLFVDRLRSTGRDVELTAEPTSSWLGDQVRRGNREAKNDFTETFLYIADRAEHTAQISKWTSEGRIVVCDRYVGSTLAYQGVTLRPHLGSRTLEWLKRVNEPIIVRPDTTFLLRIDPSKAMARLEDRKGREKFEKVTFLKKVAAMYERLAEDDPSYVVVDAERPLDEVLETVWSMVSKS
jgi:dTMP kinase